MPDLGKCKDGKAPFCEREQRLESLCVMVSASKAGGVEVALLACQPDPALGARLGQQRTTCMRPCLISETDNSCKVCCRTLRAAACLTLTPEQKNLFWRKGKPCTVGFCDMNVSIYVQYLFT